MKAARTQTDLLLDALEVERELAVEIDILEASLLGQRLTMEEFARRVDARIVKADQKVADIFAAAEADRESGVRKVGS